MNVTLNSLRTGMVLAVSIGLLAACGDRGQFRSRTYSPAEVEKYTKAQNDLDASRRARTLPPADDSNGNGVNPVMPKNPATPNLTPNVTPSGPEKTGATNSGDNGKQAGAQTKQITEVIPSADKFVQENEAIVTGAADASAVNTFKGITVSVEGNTGALALSIDAQIKVGNDLRYLNLPPSAIGFNKDGSVTVLGGAIVKENDQDVAAQIRFNSGDLQILGVCKEDGCGEIQLRVSLAGSLGQAVAVLIIKPVETQYIIVDSNLKDALRPFEMVQKDFAVKVDLSKVSTAKPASPATVPTTVIKDDGKDAAAKGNKDGVANSGNDAGGTTQVGKAAASTSAAHAADAAKRMDDASNIQTAGLAANAADAAKRMDDASDIQAASAAAAAQAPAKTAGFQLPVVNTPPSVALATQAKAAAAPAAAPSSFSADAQQRKDQSNTSFIANAMASADVKAAVAGSAAKAADASKQADDAAAAKAKQNADLGFNPDDI